jgi:hypothetical protein
MGLVSDKLHAAKLLMLLMWPDMPPADPPISLETAKNSEKETKAHISIDKS